MATLNTPYRLPRLVALALTMSLAVVFGSLTARALVILFDNGHKVKRQLPNGFLHAGDIVTASSVAVSATGLSAITALFIFILILLRRTPPKFTRHFLAFLCVFIFASGLALTIIATTHKARVTASLPRQVIDALVKASRQSLRYIKTGVVKAYCVIIWLQFLATIAATMLEYAAARLLARRAVPTSPESAAATATTTIATSPRSDDYILKK